MDLNTTELHNLMLGVENRNRKKNKKKSNEKILKLTVILKTNAYNGTKSKKN
jgi:hypothetical protein